MLTRFLMWAALITYRLFWADIKVEGFFFLNPVLVGFCLFICFSSTAVEFISCRQGSIWRLVKSSTHNIDATQWVLGLNAIGSPGVGGRWRRLRTRRKRRDLWTVDRAAGLCGMHPFASRPLMCCGWWNAGKALVYWIRSHVNSSCQRVITPSDKERGFLLTVFNF